MMGRPNKIIYPFLKEEMKRKGITILALAQKLQMRNDVLSQRLRGISPLRYEEAIAIQHVFAEVGIERLFRKEA